MGLPLACWYIGLMMLFIPFPFSHIFEAQQNGSEGRESFPQGEVSWTKERASRAGLMATAGTISLFATVPPLRYSSRIY